MTADSATLARILTMIPHAEPFRFVDELLEVSDRGASGRYRFRESEHFYRGHFPTFPVTPGVILIETMAQCSVLPLGFFLFSVDGPNEKPHSAFVLTDCRGDFLRPVFPGDTVTARSELIFWRHSKLRAKVILENQNGTAVAEGEISGMGVARA